MIAPRHTHAAPVLGLYKGALTQAFYRLLSPLATAYGERAAVTEWDAVSEDQLQAARVNA